MQNAVRELRTSYDNLVKRFEEYICDEFVGKAVDFEQYKEYFQKRFSKLKKHLLLTNQKTFVQRIDSEIDDIEEEISEIKETAKELIEEGRFEILRENGVHVLHIYDIEIEFVRRGREVILHIRDNVGKDVGSDEWNKNIEIGIEMLHTFFEDFEIIL